mgnify:CR=1 FL=1
MRKEFSKAVKLAAWHRAQGVCEKCGGKLFPGRVEYHHEKEDTFGGEPVLENCVVLCVACHRGITGERAKVVAKSNRIRNKFIGIRKKKRTIPGRRFDGTPILPRWK